MDHLARLSFGGRLVLAKQRLRGCWQMRLIWRLSQYRRYLTGLVNCARFLTALPNAACRDGERFYLLMKSTGLIRRSRMACCRVSKMARLRLLGQPRKTLPLP